MLSLCQSCKHKGSEICSGAISIMDNMVKECGRYELNTFIQIPPEPQNKFQDDWDNLNQDFKDYMEIFRKRMKILIERERDGK